MTISALKSSAVEATVIACGRNLSLLVDQPLLGTRKTCRLKVVIDETTRNGIGIALDDGVVALVVETSTRAFEPGAVVLLDSISISGGDVHFGHMRERLKGLLEVESLAGFADRAAHHALLFIMEAHDPGVRRMRLDMLRAALAPRASGLTVLERARFRQDGVIVRRRAVQPPLVTAVRTLIDDWWRNSFDPAGLERYTQTTFAPELTSNPLFRRVYDDSGIGSLAKALVQPNDVEPALSVQIQIRIPDAEQSAQPVKSVHVDGVSCPHLDAAELRTFTLLGGVLLSAVRSAEAGALHYVPGGHYVMGRWFREEWRPGTTMQVPATIDAADRMPFMGDAGDVIVMHHLVPHAVGRNFDATPRIMLYFRIKSARHDEQVLEALRDPWLEFPALRGTECDHTTSPPT